MAVEGGVIVHNPATGVEIGRVEPTPAEAVGPAIERARRAQASWRETSWVERRAWLERWTCRLAREAGEWAEAIVAEVGKPRGEAISEVAMSLDAMRWTARRGSRVLAQRRLGVGHQRWFFIPPGAVVQRPYGVVGMIGTWNFPLFLNAPAIGQAVAAGNGVVWKPSELASLAGVRLQQSLDASGLPEGLVTAVFGGPDVGKALIESGVDKGMFTGGIDNGRRVLTALAAQGTSALAELSGFDAAVVLPDAPLRSTVRALTWSAFVGAGQACVAVKRIYIVGDPAPWAAKLAEAARALRLGDPATSAVDMGPLISTAARDRFDGYIRAAVTAGARVVAGGEPRPGPGAFYLPTVLVADSAAPEAVLEGVFGPVVLVRGVADADAAVAAANNSRFGLAASVWARDRRAAGSVAARLEAGQVSVNDAVVPTGHAAAPFGGFKASGFGRIKGAYGLLDFVQPQAVFVRRAGGLRPQCFPYAPRTERMLTWYLRLFHGRG